MVVGTSSEDIDSSSHMSTPELAMPFCAYSVPEWIRQPTPYEGIFGLELPYTPPQNPIAAFVWRCRLWLEVTFALSMLQPWEKLLTIISFYTVLFLVSTTFMVYIPTGVALVHSRLAFFAFGSEPAATSLVG